MSPPLPLLQPLPLLLSPSTVAAAAITSTITITIIVTATITATATASSLPPLPAPSHSPPPPPLSTRPYVSPPFSSQQRPQAAPAQDFPPPTGREYILRTTIPRPRPSSRPCPQRMYCVLTNDEFRLAGAFTNDVIFQ